MKIPTTLLLAAVSAAVIASRSMLRRRVMSACLGVTLVPFFGVTGTAFAAANPRGPVAAVSRAPNLLDLFITGPDGVVYTSWWTAGSDWSGKNNYFDALRCWRLMTWPSGEPHYIPGGRIKWQR